MDKTQTTSDSECQTSHGITSQRTAFFIVTAVKTSNLRPKILAFFLRNGKFEKFCCYRRPEFYIFIPRAFL
jgi:hypothetical protein